jgi:adenine-specific DNA glycosylase
MIGNDLIDDDSGVEEACRQLLSNMQLSASVAITSLGRVQHLFSHIRLTMIVHHTILNDSQQLDLFLQTNQTSKLVTHYYANFKI